MAQHLRAVANHREMPMYYDPRRNDHGLSHNPMTALVVPRPIGWISTVSRSAS